ncbi:hypothetical protein HID58_019648 [Brassica napus]|uniref:Peptidase A1 domain-containing protein n=1 Tax=Brassica napus TaxID=3708 RepID=A0ABQ8DDG6_BRANA|nr:hypothetical protein HID58_019648 [Brassica napus]
MKPMTMLFCLITMFLIASAYSNTVMRLDMTHRDTLSPIHTPYHRIEDIFGEDKRRHSLISQKIKTTKSGARMSLGSGFDFGAAQYFSEIMVGTPAKKFRVVVDTGSELTWVNCRFQGKGKENREVFRAEGSSSFKTVGCMTKTCKVDLMNLFSLSICPTPQSPCSYDYRYADGSTAQGVFATDTFTLGLTNGSPTSIPGLLIGCSSSTKGDSLRASDGVLGLAFSDQSFTAKATNIFGAKFSYCLVDHTSNKNISNYLTFGSNPTSTLKPPARRTARLELNLLPPFYAVSIVGISIGNTMLNIPPVVWEVRKGGGTILDSGSSLTFLADAAYKAVVSGLERHLVGLKRVKPEGLPMEYCFDTSKFDDSKLPQLSFHFKGGARFAPYRKSYLIATASPGIRCLGFVPAGAPAPNVIGNIMQQKHLWDLDLKRTTLKGAKQKKKQNKRTKKMKTTTTMLLCLITMLLIASAHSKEETAMRLDMKHRDSLSPNPSPYHRIEDIMGMDQKRHNVISQKIKTTKGGVKMSLGSGFDYGAAQYFSEIMVGTPAKRFRVVVDTGSELTWVNCRFHGQGPEKLENRHVFRAENSYVDGSSAQGVFAKETFTLGLTNGSVTSIRGLLIGCSSNSEGGASFRETDGILGLALSDYSFTAKATNIFGGKFSYCLVDHTSHKNVSNYLIFGSTPSSTTTKAPARRTTRLDLSILPPFYAVNIVGISIGEEMLNIPPQVWGVKKGGGTILDSGSSLTFLAEAAYKAVVTGLQRHLVGVKRIKPEGLPIEFCYYTTKFDDRKLPQLTFHFKGGTRFAPYRRSYLINAAPGIRCLGFVEAKGEATNVIGNIMQQNHLWEFDIAASTLSFSPSTCL